MFNWLWKKLGYHVCEDFTPWENVSSLCERPATFDESVFVGLTKVKYTRRWQERKCKECGRIWQEELDFGGPYEDELG